MVSLSTQACLDLLIVSADYSTLKMFVCAWRETGSRIDSTASIACAHDLLQSRRMHGIVVDMRLQGACDFIRQTRKHGGQEEPVIIACTGSREEEQAGLAAGANFVVQKPISTGKVFDLLTLGASAQTRQRRLSVRRRLVVPVTIFRDGLQYRALSSDLSEGGMAIRSARISGTDASLDFFLEVNSIAVAGRGRVMWNGESGYAGIRFDSVRCSNPLPFPQWLEKQDLLMASSI